MNQDAQSATSASAAVFNAHAARYEAQRRQLIPPYDSFYGTGVAALSLAGAVRRVLDLGAGTGLLARHVIAAYPAVEITLCDGAPAMLAEARALLGDRARVVRSDLDDPPAAGPWDAVVSALAIHHLADDRKRRLFSRIHGVLRPGGVFVNCEQVAAPTGALDEAYAAWHRREATRRGADEEVWAGAVRRMRMDRCSTVEDQLGWLRDARFRDVDCLFKDHCFAVLVARKAS